MLNVLVADDDVNVLESVAGALSEAGHQVTSARDGAEAASLLASCVFDLAICDVHMPKLGGLSLLRRIRQEAPDTAVVLMTSYADIPEVVDSMRGGAVDFITKPFDPHEFAERVVRPLAEHRSIRQRFEDARARFAARHAGAIFIAESPATHRLNQRIAVLARSEASVLITGERGAGKELVARTIHARGPRWDRPLVYLDGATLLERITASERAWLVDDRVPRETWLREAEGGTLVLDRIEKLPTTAQAHVLRALDEPWARAARSQDGAPSGVRLITLSRDAWNAGSGAGYLLESLRYRLGGVHVHVPALRERREDLFLLAAQLLREIEPPDRAVPVLSSAALDALAGYPYPGNVRELRQILELAVALADGGPIDVDQLPAEVVGKR